MRVCITGSRRYQHLERVKNIVDSLPADTQLLVGDAVGVDWIVYLSALERRLAVRSFLADWAQFGRSAGPIRNHQMVNEADCVIGFWDGESPGTKDTLYYAIAQRKPVEVHWSPCACVTTSPNEHPACAGVAVHA